MPSKKMINYEFLKLDEIDLKVACWLYEKHPKALYSYLKMITESKKIDTKKVHDELLRLLQLK